MNVCETLLCVIESLIAYQNNTDVPSAFCLPSLACPNPSSSHPTHKHSPSPPTLQHEPPKRCRWASAVRSSLLTWIGPAPKVGLPGSSLPPSCLLPPPLPSSSFPPTHTTPLHRRTASQGFPQGRRAPGSAGSRGRGGPHTPHRRRPRHPRYVPFLLSPPPSLLPSPIPNPFHLPSPSQSSRPPLPTSTASAPSSLLQRNLPPPPLPPPPPSPSPLQPWPSTKPRVNPPSAQGRRLSPFVGRSIPC